MKKIFKILGIVIASVAILLTTGIIILYNIGLSGMNKYKEAKDNQIKVACVGDSITYGHGISNWSKNNYPVKLQELLGDDYCVNNYGVSGFCVQDDADKPYSSVEAYRKGLDFDADILVFMLGSNDAKPYNWKGIDAFEEDYEKLLNSYLENNTDLEVYLCTPATAFDDDVSTSESSFDIQPSIVEEIAEFVREYAQEKGYKLIDINNLTEGRSDLISSDLIHPNKEGALEIAKEVVKNIKK